MKEIYIGKIVNTFGIKGQLKVMSDFERPNLAFKENNKIIIENNIYTLTEVKLHKGNYLIKINNINDINEVLSFKDRKIYINKDELNLNKEDYLYEELLDLKVKSDNITYGLVTEVLYGINPLIKVDNKFYIPLKGDFIKKVDLNKKEIITSDLKGLII